MRHAFLFVALSMLMSDVAMARCWGANGYCTRERREQREACDARREMKSLQEEKKLLNRHRHPTYESRARDHQRLTYVNERLQSLKEREWRYPAWKYPDWKCW